MLFIKSIIFYLIFIINSVCTYSGDYKDDNHSETSTGLVLSRQFADDTCPLRLLSNSENVHPNTTGPIHNFQLSDGTCLLRLPISSAEWHTYHTIRQKEIVERYCAKSYVYNPDHPDELSPSNFRFVLFHMILQKVVGVIRVDLLDEEGESSIRWVAITETYQKKGYGSRMLRLVESFLIIQKRNLLRVPSEDAVKNFYLKFGFDHADWPKAPQDDGKVFLSKRVNGLS